MPVLDVTIVGKMHLPDIWSGPIIPPGGGPVPPLGIWGPTDPRPTPPIYLPPGYPGSPPSGAHPEHPIFYPPGIWGPTDPRPTPPIVIPPDAISPGVPSHPIYIPVYPAHPIVIPPDAIAPGVPTHPIFLPVYPAHPIVIPPDAIAPGVPTHPIYLPPGIWGPTDPRPTPPIANVPGLPPMSPGGPGDPPGGQPPAEAGGNWQWGWNVSSGWHPVYVPNTGGKPQPVPPPTDGGGDPNAPHPEHPIVVPPPA